MSDLITILSHGERKTMPRVYKSGTKTSRYNHERECYESIVIERDCLIDVDLTYNAHNESWERTSIKWETARPLPPEPPGFIKRAWLWVKARLTRTRLPAARLLKD